MKTYTNESDKGKNFLLLQTHVMIVFTVAVMGKLIYECFLIK